MGKYEFSGLSRSLFLPDGSIYLAYDTSKVMHAIVDLATANQREDSQISTVSPSRSSNVLPVASGQMNANDTSKNKKSVIIFDGMALVNSIQKTECVKTCKDFAEVFLANLIQASHGYNEVRLVFDRYMQGSLKEKMREKRAGGNKIQYHVDDRTVLTHIPLKQFLSHIQTRAELTTYLADKCLVYFSEHTDRLCCCVRNNSTKQSR